MKITLQQDNIAQEVIDVQTDDFGSRLEALITEMIEGVEAGTFNRKQLQESDFKKKFESLIFKRLGLTIDVNFNTECGGAVMPFHINKNSVLLDSYWRGDFQLPDQEKLLKVMNGRKGTVDLKHAKVSGMFSEYAHKMWLDVIGNYRKYDLSAAEITAIVLHEQGHAFTYYEFSDRMETTNRVLQELVLNIHSDGDRNERVYLFKELGKKTTGKETEFSDLVDEENRIILGIKLFQRYVQNIKSQLPNDKYSETASEQLADNFASRFGFGRQLVTGLDKFYRKDGSPEISSSLNTMSFLVEVCQFIAMAGGILVLLAGGAVLAGAVGIAVMGFAVFISGEQYCDYTYDELKLRYTRIRHQYVERISSLEMKKDELQKVVNEIHALDAIINNTYKYRAPMRMIANVLFSKHGQANKDIQLQQMIEALAHNDLFLKSAELQAL